jgi:hypothetical protein
MAANAPAPGKLPSNTPISDLGFTADQLAKLPAAAQKLTKGDLIQLQKWGEAGGKGDPPAGLTVQDVKALEAASPPAHQLQAQAKKSGPADAAQDVTACCCCCPCCTCTAAAEVVPLRTA